MAKAKKQAKKPTRPGVKATKKTPRNAVKKAPKPKPKSKPAATKKKAPPAATAARKKPVAAKKPVPRARPDSGGMTIRIKKPLPTALAAVAQLQFELAQIIEKRPAPPKTLSPVDADRLVGGTWFAGYTNTVQLVEEPVTLARFDGDSRGGDAEYIIFNRGLNVTGTLDLSEIYRSIIVVRGTLKARQIILGDAVLVADRVHASELVYGPMTEGIFQVAGMQIESDPEDVATAIDAPVVALYDRNQREWLLRRNGVPAELAGDLVDDGDVDASAMKKRLFAGKSIFS